MSNKLLSMQMNLRKDGVIISFSGKFSQEIIEELGQALKRYLETEEQPKTDIFNVFSIFIEQTQNIKNYCNSKSETNISEVIAGSCIVIIGYAEDGGKYVCSGNFVDNNDIIILEETVKQLIKMDKKELKRLYKQKIKEDISPGDTSAGLGLIDIARKASMPLEYSIEKIDDAFSFFTLKAIV